MRGRWRDERPRAPAMAAAHFLALRDVAGTNAALAEAGFVLEERCHPRVRGRFLHVCLHWRRGDPPARLVLRMRLQMDVRFAVEVLDV